MDLYEFPMFNEFPAQNYYYTLCNTAGTML